MVFDYTILQGGFIMPKTCKKCGESFKTAVKIDGKYRYLTNRRYCLKCSPWKEHNTKKLHKTETKTSICSLCKRKYEYIRNKGHTKKVCNSCNQSLRRKRIKKILVDELGGKCSVCGYDKHIEVLQFHHKDPSMKKFGLGSSWNQSLKTLREESKKCIVLCANCHIEEHLRTGTETGS